LAIREFINADEIARGLSPLNAEGAAFTAGRLLIERIKALAAAGESFAFETTCSGRGHVRLLNRLKARHYRLTLVFLWLPSAEAAVERVARRVNTGGHNVPESVVRRRYFAGMRNMQNLYLPLVDRALIYDNSDGGGRLIAERRPDAAPVIHDSARWKQIEEASL
jgi:predicted ABC-type ATPase